MSRRHRAQKRERQPDPLYKSELVAYFINMLMLKGKKNLAQSIVYGALDQFCQNIGAAESLETKLAAFVQAVENVKPVVEVKSRRVGGATYQVPIEIHPDRRTSLAFRWLISYARGRKGMPIQEALSRELQDSFNNTGSSIKKRDDTHRMAEANRAFAHYRW